MAFAEGFIHSVRTYILTRIYTATMVISLHCADLLEVPPWRRWFLFVSLQSTELVSSSSFSLVVVVYFPSSSHWSRHVAFTDKPRPRSLGFIDDTSTHTHTHIEHDGRQCRSTRLWNMVQVAADHRVISSRVTNGTLWPGNRWWIHWQVVEGPMPFSRLSDWSTDATRRKKGWGIQGRSARAQERRRRRYARVGCLSTVGSSHSSYFFPSSEYKSTTTATRRFCSNSLHK